MAVLAKPPVSHSCIPAYIIVDIAPPYLCPSMHVESLTCILLTPEIESNYEELYLAFRASCIR